MGDYFKIICELCSPLCGDAPKLDALIVSELIFKQKLCQAGEKLSKGDPISKFKIPSVPLYTEYYNNIPLYHVSDPIYFTNFEFREDFCCHIEPELYFLLAEEDRKSISSVSGKYKDTRLPLRLKNINKIIWFCRGTKDSILEILQENIFSIGTKRKQGFGVVNKWFVEDIDKDYSFFAEKENKKVLMKTLPELFIDKKNTIGYSIQYGACSPPYWHPGRYMNVAIPI